MPTPPRDGLAQCEARAARAMQTPPRGRARSRDPLGIHCASFRHARFETRAPALPAHVVFYTASPGVGCERVRGARSTGRQASGGTICIEPAGQDAVWRRFGAEVEFLHVYLAPQLLSRVAAEHGQREPELRDAFAVHDPALVNRLRLLERQLDPPWADALLLDCLGGSLALHLLRHYTAEGCSKPVMRGGLTPRQTRRVEEYVEAHFAEPLRLADLARVAGLSTHHFARSFRERLGVPPYQYILNVRIRAALALLQRSCLPVAEVARRTGFASQSHLTHLFRSRLGVTPASVRAERPGGPRPLAAGEA